MLNYTTKKPDVKAVHLCYSNAAANEIAIGLRWRGVTRARVFERNIKAGNVQIKVWVVVQYNAATSRG